MTTRPNEFLEIEEFRRFLTENFQYKIVVQGKRYSPKQYDKFKYYKSLTPIEFQFYKAGICWDFTAYEAFVFHKRWPYVKTKLFYIEGEPTGTTHTFLVYWNENQRPVLFEPVLTGCKGCFEFKTEKELLIFMANKVFQYRSKKNLFVTEFKQPSQYGLTAQEFINIASSGKLRMKQGKYFDHVK